MSVLIAFPTSNSFATFLELKRAGKNTSACSILNWWANWDVNLSSIYHPWKWTCPLKRNHFKRKIVFQAPFFREHVSFHPKGLPPPATLRLRFQIRWNSTAGSFCGFKMTTGEIAFGKCRLTKLEADEIFRPRCLDLRVDGWTPVIEVMTSWDCWVDCCVHVDIQVKRPAVKLLINFLIFNFGFAWHMTHMTIYHHLIHTSQEEQLIYSSGRNWFIETPCAWMERRTQSLRNALVLPEVSEEAAEDLESAPAMVNFDFAFGTVFYWDCRVVAVVIWFPYEPGSIWTVSTWTVQYNSWICYRKHSLTILELRNPPQRNYWYNI